ncbi:unnamed protein product [Agarophyton chilense]
MSSTQDSHSEQGESEALSDENLRRLAPDLFDNESKKTHLLQLRDFHRRYDELYDDYMMKKMQLEEQLMTQLKPVLQERKLCIQKSGLDDFWSTVFEHCETLSENITTRDALALRYLEDVSCEVATSQHKIRNKPKWPTGSFILYFTFRNNPFFENQTLTKSYIMCEQDFEHASQTLGCSIKWKGGKDLTVKTLRKKGQNGKTLVKKQKTDSFFNFFDPPKMACCEEDEGRMEEIEEVLDADFELAECLKDDVIPRALLYYVDVAQDSECQSANCACEEDGTHAAEGHAAEGHAAEGHAAEGHAAEGEAAEGEAAEGEAAGVRDSA